MRARVTNEEEEKHGGCTLAVGQREEGFAGHH
jgi:hypothetical protein